MENFLGYLIVGGLVILFLFSRRFRSACFKTTYAEKRGNSIRVVKDGQVVSDIDFGEDVELISYSKTNYTIEIDGERQIYDIYGNLINKRSSRNKR